MQAILTDNSYGKSRVRLVHVDRSAASHELLDLSVDIQLTGEFAAAHVDADNSEVLPTDTMKNTVYALAGRHGVGSVETFGARLAHHFLRCSALVSEATIELAQERWQRIATTNNPEGHPWSFVTGAGGSRTARVRGTRTADGVSTRITSGVAGMRVLKTTGSGFSNFLRDDLTTLPETDDRILSTIVTAEWDHAEAPTVSLTDAAWDAAWTTARAALLDVFADEYSVSVQQTLYLMGEAMLARCPQLERVRFTLPNRHCLLVNLEPFGLDNPNTIFVPTDEPHGLISGTVERAPAPA